MSFDSSRTGNPPARSNTDMHGSRDQTRKDALRRTLSTVSTRGSLTNWSPFGPPDHAAASLVEYSRNDPRNVYGFERPREVHTTAVVSDRTQPPTKITTKAVDDSTQRFAEERSRNRHISLRMFDQKPPNDTWPSFWNRFPSPSDVQHKTLNNPNVPTDERVRTKDLRLDTTRTDLFQPTNLQYRSPSSASSLSPDTRTHSLRSAGGFADSPMFPQLPLAASDDEDLTQKFRRQSLHTEQEYEAPSMATTHPAQYTKFRVTDGFVYDEEKAKSKNRTVERINPADVRHISPGRVSNEAGGSKGQLSQGPPKEARDKDEWLKFAKSRQGSDGSVIFKCLWIEDGKACGYYGKRHLVKRHVETRHLQIRDHVCPYCSKAFAQKTALHIHVNRHTGEKPHACKFNCGMYFNDPARKHKHQIEVHNYEAKAPPKRFTKPGHYTAQDDVFSSSESSGDDVPMNN